MKKLIALLILLHSTANAALDGTVAIVYKGASHAFLDGEYARGFVRLNKGFSVPAASVLGVNLNLAVPVAGPIDLNDTGKIILKDPIDMSASDLIFDSNVTLVDGQGMAIVLNGNLAVPAGDVLEFVSDTIIDGQGHQLVLTDGSPGGQLYINGPAGTRLTLRNMTLRGVRDYPGDIHAIRFGTNADQVLVLENVTLHLGNDFVFIGGKLEISGTVKIVNPFIIFYQASEDITILPDSTLFFDVNSALVYEPSDKKNKHVIFTDKTSQLFLNGCTLFVPKDTGLQLTKGHLIIDHKTDLQSDFPTADDRVIQIGNGNMNHDLTIDIMPAAQLELEDAYLRYKNAGEDKKLLGFAC